jgi:sulfate/thiosulfate transport system substrate-binding protein
MSTELMEISMRRPHRTAAGRAGSAAGPAGSAAGPAGSAAGPRGKLLGLVLLAALGLAVLSGCGGPAEEGQASGGDGGGGELSLVAYSTPKEAYEELIPAFAKTPQGAGVSFTQSYGSSGDQSRAVESGLPADVIALSLAPDVDRLVEPGIVAPDWAQDEFGGFVTNSVVVFAVRKGNPENIETWEDLTREGVEVITPNPFTSGGAKWNLMAAYGAQLEQGKSPQQALDHLTRLLQNTPVQDKSAREALQTFAGGKGDVLLAYENEAITAQNADVELDYVIPDETILIQNPVAVAQESESPEQAKAFVEWLRQPEAQEIFASKGYRTVREELADEQTYPTPKALFTIDEFGGWDKVNDEFFDPDTGSVAKIEQDLGVSTAK